MAQECACVCVCVQMCETVTQTDTWLFPCSAAEDTEAEKQHRRGSNFDSAAGWEFPWSISVNMDRSRRMGFELAEAGNEYGSCL